MNKNKINRLLSSVTFFLFFIISLPALASSQTNIVTDILFIAYDQGESSAFIELHKQLDKEGTPYRVLAMGKAKEIFSHHPGLLLLDDDITPDNHRLDRNLLLDKPKLKLFTDKISAPIIYGGMASRAQAQLINTLASSQRRTIGFYDNFDSVEEKDYTRPFLQELDQIDEFHVPSHLTAKSFKNIAANMQAKVVVTGQPALEGWNQVFQNADRAALRNHLGISHSQKIIVFSGGYDDTYPASFELFMQATQLSPDTLFLVTHHPKYSGELETKIITKYSNGNVRLIKNGTFSTTELSTIASKVIVHKSSVAQQALYQGIPSLYIADNSFNNLMIKHGLAKKAYSPEDIHAWVDEKIRQQTAQFSTILGMPEQPIRYTISLLKIFLTQYHESVRKNNLPDFNL
ncbi:hypothetical protein ACH42_12650 [Endozoicomonas sp. (ex Bugula neritina AB1)]|nr:hypothetical protein ACH42_12650 [Endozoicomonas sp. (ex Bugula neritina AB1)]